MCIDLHRINLLLNKMCSQINSMENEEGIEKEYEELKDIKTTNERPEIQFFPRRVGLGYKVEYKSIDKSYFKSLNKKKSIKMIQKTHKKTKLDRENNSEDALQRGSKK